MTSLNAASIVFDISGLLLSLLVICIIYRRMNMNRVFVWMLSGSILHIISLAMNIYILITAGEKLTGRVAAYVICVIAARLTFLAILAVSAAFEGEMIGWKGINSVGVKVAGLAFLPVVAAAVCRAVWHINPEGFAASLSLLMVYEYLETRRHREILEREKIINIRQAKVMTEQMQPHFVYNSLMSIQYLIYTDPERAASCLNDFTGYLRGNIDALTSEEPIPFKTELEHIKQYIALEKAGADCDFSVEYDFETEDFMVPALTVQPIVENAVKHGALSHRDGTGRVRIAACQAGSFIQITVEDNGVPVSMTERQKNHQSVGIQNAQARLDTQCGGTLTVNRTNTGTLAVITVPKGG